MIPAVTAAVAGPAPFLGKLNRRRYTRVPTRQMRSCFLAQGVGPANGWVVDISLGGVFLRTSWPLPVGEQLAIELPRAGQSAPVCVRGRVVSSSPLGTHAARSGMGVRFDALDPLTLSQLRELISSLAPAGTRLEQQPQDWEVTTVVPAPKLSAPQLAAPLPKLTAAKATPIPPAGPSAPRPLVRDLAEAVENERLRNHAKGLLMQVGDLQVMLSVKEREIVALREAVAHLQASNGQLLRNPR